MNPNSGIIVDDTTDDTIKNRRNDVVDLIKKTPSITKKEIARALNVSGPTVVRDTKPLQEMDIIVRNGPKKMAIGRLLTVSFENYLGDALELM